MHAIPSHLGRGLIKKPKKNGTTMDLILKYLVLYPVYCYSWFSVDVLTWIQQDNLSFPLICSDWNADEEILLLEVMHLFVWPFTFRVVCFDCLPIIFEGNWNVWAGKLGWGCRACWYKVKGTMHRTLYNSVHEFTLLSPPGNYSHHLFMSAVEKQTVFLIQCHLMIVGYVPNHWKEQEGTFGHG
jgi:hypothetical protein